MFQPIEFALSTIHYLAGAVWFGALIYRTFFVDPRAKRFFERPQQYEHYALNLAQGMRWVVLLALVITGATGFTLVGLRWQDDAMWQRLMLAKVIIWIVALGIFAYISWVYWPQRVFMVPSESKRLNAQGLGLALGMIAISGLGILLGRIALVV
jgi:uncharacterized membrane protein